MDSIDVYSALALARKGDTALKEAQVDNRTLSTRIRELEGNSGFK